MAQTRNPRVGRVAPGFLFEGELSGKGTLDVHGELRAQIARFGTLRVHPSGVVTAPTEIRAEKVYVAGVVQGAIHATDKVLVRASGVIHGDVRAPSFGLAAGGRVEGKVSTPEAQGDAPRRRRRRP